MRPSTLLSALAPPLCWTCGRPAVPGLALCRGCRADLRWLGDEPVDLGGVPTWAPVAYEGPARDLVRALKFRSAAGLARTLATQIVANAPAELLAGAQLVPVPLHRTRRRERGFNQAEALAAAIGERSRLEVIACLERTGAGGRQVGRSRAQRLAVAGGVVVRPDAAVPGCSLLVDDVITTGATLAACARALAAAGATEVRAVAYARTPLR